MAYFKEFFLRTKLYFYKKWSVKCVLFVLLIPVFSHVYRLASIAAPHFFTHNHSFFIQRTSHAWKFFSANINQNHSITCSFNYLNGNTKTIHLQDFFQSQISATNPFYRATEAVQFVSNKHIYAWGYTSKSDSLIFIQDLKKDKSLNFLYHLLLQYFPDYFINCNRITISLSKQAIGSSSKVNIHTSTILLDETK